MVETYTVQNVMATGKDHDTYGKEFYVKFVESEQTFPLWFKKAPDAGTKINGEINGSKFKKDKTPPADETPKNSPVSRGRYDSDGQRQGMCINNAANYVNSCATEIVTPKKWAETVHGYANALYLLGDLGQVPAEPAAENTGELFGGKSDDSK